MKKEYIVTYESGGGSIYDDGTWIVKRTPKTIIAEKIKDNGVGIYANHKVGEKIKIGKDTGSPIRELDDERFIVYFRQAGTPYLFTPIEMI